MFDIDNILPRYIIHFDCLGEPLRQGSELERILNQSIGASGELCFKFSDYHELAVGPWKSYFRSWTLFPLCMTLRWSLFLCQPCWDFVKISQYPILETPILFTTVCFKGLISGVPLTCEPQFCDGRHTSVLRTFQKSRHVLGCWKNEDMIVWGKDCKNALQLTANNYWNEL